MDFILIKSNTEVFKCLNIEFKGRIRLPAASLGRIRRSEASLGRIRRSEASLGRIRLQTVNLVETFQITESIQMEFRDRGDIDSPPSIQFKYVTSEVNKTIKVEVKKGSNEFTNEFTPLSKEEIWLTIKKLLQPAYKCAPITELTIKVTLRESTQSDVPCQGVIQDLALLLNNQKLTDFKFKVEDKDFHVHKAILAARSSVFMTMFTGEFEEKKTSAGIIKNISHDAFSDFLRYLYSDSVNNLKSHVIELLAVAHMYEVQGLKKLCESELLRGLSEENSADIFQYAHLYQCDRSLKEASFNLIKSSFKKNNYEIPDEYVDSPKEIKSLIAVKEHMAKLLKKPK